MTSLILGIDPDAFGALALVDRETGELADLLDMPMVELKGARLIDLVQLAIVIDTWAPKIGEAWIEKAWARPTDPPSFAFRVGHNYGGLVGLIRAQFIRLHIVSPQRWKKSMGVSSDKELSRQEASARWPRDCARWKFKKNHGRAEAALIAAYGLQESRKERGHASQA